MESSARVLYDSLRATKDLPEFLQILPGHGAGSACGKALGAIPQSVMGYERQFNHPLHLALTDTRDHFVKNILEGQPEPPVYFARMKRDNRTGQPLRPEGKLPAPKRFSPDELKDFLSSPDHLVLDLRTSKAAFARKHLRGALFAPLKGTELPEAAGSFIVDETTPLVLLLESETDREEAVRQLIRIGYDQLVGWLPVDEALASGAETSAFERIETKELPDALKSKPGHVLDVRKLSEYRQGHFEGAQQIAHTRLAAQVDKVPKDETIYVHCGSGMRAAKSAAFLESQGFEVVHVDGPVDGLLATCQTNCA